jgi:hypothetical protein
MRRWDRCETGEEFEGSSLQDGTGGLVFCGRYVGGNYEKIDIYALVVWKRRSLRGQALIAFPED